MGRLAVVLYLATLALLPWGGIVRFPWLHENAQWSDVTFALATLAWAVSAVSSKRLPKLRLVHAGAALYLGWALVSLVAADPRPASGGAKLLGMAMLVVLMVVTSDLASRPGLPRAIATTVAVTSLLTAAAAIVGVVLSATGRITPLVGTCGDLLPGPLSRAQAGFPHPNLLASFCVVAAGAVAWKDAALSRRLRLLVQAALAVTVVLTVSRAILAFVLAAAIRAATTPGRRVAAQATAGALVLAMVGLTILNVTFSVARPWEAQVLSTPSVRLQSVATSLETLGLHPILGTGPGTSPGRRGPLEFDAHLTPLNIAATLGVPALLGFLLVPLALWQVRGRPTDLAIWGMLAGLALDGLGQDVEDFRHVWVAFGLADAGRAEAGREAAGREGAGREDEAPDAVLVRMNTPVAGVSRPAPER
jgi:hypothetical protein